MQVVPPVDDGQLLLVLGMHRSGTSALTGLMQKLGAELGEELLAPTLDNPKGYFENARVVTAHEALFAALGRSWQNPRPLPEDWRATAAGDEAHEALTELLRAMLVEGRLVAVKDPRASRFAPLWRDVARAAHVELGAILMVRHPAEVAASLYKRDGLSRARSHLLWIVYLLDAERGTRGLSRAFVSYEALLADWRGSLTRMQAAGLESMLPQPTPAAAQEIDSFLDISLRRHEANVEGRERSPFEALALELYGLALRCESMAVSDVEAQFDNVAQLLAPLAARYLDAPLQLEQEIERQRCEQAQISATLQLAALRELWRPAFPAAPPGAARLYYRVEGTDFAELRAVSSYPEISGTRRTVTFELHSHEQFDHLRFDPDSAPGVYAIESVAVCGEMASSMPKRIKGVHEHLVPTTREGDIVRFAAFGEDPHFIFDARGLARLPEGAGETLRVEVCFRFETVMSEVGGYLDDYRSALTAHGRDLVSWQAEVGRGVRALADQHARIESVLEVVPEVLERQRQVSLDVGMLTTQLGGVPDVQAETLEMLKVLEAQSSAAASELESIRAEQSTMMEWMQRRSPRHWWRRLMAFLIRG